MHVCITSKFQRTENMGSGVISRGGTLRSSMFSQMRIGHGFESQHHVINCNKRVFRLGTKNKTGQKSSKSSV